MSCSVRPTVTMRSGFDGTVVVPNLCSTRAGKGPSPSAAGSVVSEAVIRPAAGQQQRSEQRRAASRFTRRLLVGRGRGSPSAAAARRGTSSFISSGMLSTDGNEVAS